MMRMLACVSILTMYPAFFMAIGRVSMPMPMLALNS